MIIHLKLEGESSTLCGVSGLRIKTANKQDRVTCKNCLRKMAGDPVELDQKRKSIDRRQNRILKGGINWE
jgi:hypothetical protein